MTPDHRMTIGEARGRRRVPGVRSVLGRRIGFEANGAVLQATRLWFHPGDSVPGTFDLS